MSFPMCIQNGDDDVGTPIYHLTDSTPVILVYILLQEQEKEGQG